VRPDGLVTASSFVPTPKPLINEDWVALKSLTCQFFEIGNAEQMRRGG